MPVRVLATGVDLTYEVYVYAEACKATQCSGGGPAHRGYRKTTRLNPIGLGRYVKRLRSCGSFHPCAEEQRNDQTIAIEKPHLNKNVPVGICLSILKKQTINTRGNSFFGVLETALDQRSKDLGTPSAGQFTLRNDACPRILLAVADK